MSLLTTGFKALCETHGSKWSFGGAVFTAVAQDGSYAARNFIDGNADVKVLRVLSVELPCLPGAGARIKDAGGSSKIVARSKRIDEHFSEIEING